MFSAITPRSLVCLLLVFQFCQYLRWDTVNQPLNVVQLAFQLCPFHRIFHLAFSLALALASNRSFSAKRSFIVTLYF